MLIVSGRSGAVFEKLLRHVVCSVLWMFCFFIWHFWQIPLLWNSQWKKILCFVMIFLTSAFPLPVCFFYILYKTTDLAPTSLYYWLWSCEPLYERQRRNAVILCWDGICMNHSNVCVQLRFPCPNLWTQEWSLKKFSGEKILKMEV